MCEMHNIKFISAPFEVFGFLFKLILVSHPGFIVYAQSLQIHNCPQFVAKTLKSCHIVQCYSKCGPWTSAKLVPVV